MDVVISPKLPKNLWQSCLARSPSCLMHGETTRSHTETATQAAWITLTRYHQHWSRSEAVATQFPGAARPGEEGLQTTQALSEHPSASPAPSRHSQGEHPTSAHQLIN